MKAIFLIILTATIVGFWLYLNPSYPHNTILVDKQGREIEATLLGRTQETVSFQRNGESTIFKYPIRWLSAETQNNLKRFPIEEFPETVVGPDPFIAFREGEIARIEKKILKLEHELLQSRTGVPSQNPRIVQQEIRRLRSEVSVIRKEIEIYQREQGEGIDSISEKA